VWKGTSPRSDRAAHVVGTPRASTWQARFMFTSSSPTNLAKVSQTKKTIAVLNKLSGRCGYWVKAPDDRPRVTIARTEIIKISIIFISTNMTPIEAALDSLKSLKLGETPNYAEISKKYGCDRNTLSRRH